MSKTASEMASVHSEPSARSRQRPREEPSVQDPPRVDWAGKELPQTWPDGSDRRGLLGGLRLLLHPFRRRRKVAIPESLPGASRIPKYALLEFHNLPNGNYSSRITRGYIKGFDITMLGEMGRVRRRMARDLKDCRSILDIGCGGGRMVALLHEQGKHDAWGMDPSPYLLKHAAEDSPDVPFTQGVMEDIPFSSARFDGITVGFVFHEMPPAYVRQGLAEIARVLKPGGRLTVAEPSPLHFRATFFSAIRQFGWRGAYFWTLVRSVHEPFVKAWHQFDLPSEAARYGLELQEVDEGMPIKYWVFRRRPAA
jgi:ubiquinone/menaquinone biosynthesis C-methylase UbiE